MAMSPPSEHRNGGSPSSTNGKTVTAKVRVKVWDAPTRLFHWALAVALGVAWWSGEEGDFTVHFIAGHIVVGLIVFRLIWGLIGSDTARFSHFVRGPGAVVSYLGKMAGKSPDYTVGHNPAGALMVVALLLLVAIQAGTGLFASENTWAFVSGPLAGLVDGETSSTLTSLHKGALFDALVILAGMHIAAAFLYLIVKRENLIRPMVLGSKPLPAGKADPPPRMVSPLLGVMVFSAVAVLIGWLYSLT